MVLLLHPPLLFLKTQNKDSDGIVLLAPPRPWRQRKRFATTVATAIRSNGSRPVVNGKRTSRERACSSCTPFAALLTTNCVICRRASAPLPLAATGAPCSGVTYCHLPRYVKACCEWWENRWRKGRFGLSVQQSTCWENTNNLPSRLALRQGEERRRRSKS